MTYFNEFLQIESKATEPEILMFENFDLTNVVTPVKPDVLEQLLINENYNPEETRYLVDGFRRGFDIGYKGKTDVKMTAPNLKLRVGSEMELWNKVMKEVKLKRYAGPFAEIPYDTFIQSPIGLVPKDQGRSTHLIFHLSYPRNGLQQSLNANTPDELKRVKYTDFDQAIQICLDEGRSCSLSKSDMSSAFRQVGILPEQWRYLIMKARSPVDHKWYYFVDKCLPFGAAISCAIFQRISNAIAFLIRARTGKRNVNYLDDFLFAALLKWLCDHQMNCFLELCDLINFPVALEKTFWSTTRLTFLGLLIDTVAQMVFIPIEKIQKGRDLVNRILERESKKTTIRELQELCGFLNFLGRAIIPGHAFTRRLYHYTKSNGRFKPHHHVRINQEMRLDLQMWKIFLYHHTMLARPFLDISKKDCIKATMVDMDSDASGNFSLGMGATCAPNWIAKQWNEAFCSRVKPSIEYLELYAVVPGILLWIHKFRNKRIILFCDNMSVVNMINNTSSSCKNCMVLIRLLVLKGLTENVRIFASHITSKANYFSDSLSRLKMDLFWKLSEEKGKPFNAMPDEMPDELWPMQKIWLN